jgi:hypothetical protein
MHPTASNGIPVLKTSSYALPKLLSNKDALDDGLKSHFASVWNIFKDLIARDEDTFTNATKYLRGVQTFAPMEMVAVMVLISMYSKTRNTRLLLGDIHAMREAIRENHADIRMNAILWKSIWDFLENLEAIRGAVNGSTVNRRTEQPSPSSTASIPVAGEKRKATARMKRPDILPSQPSQQPLTGSYQSKKQRIKAESMHPGPIVEQLNDIFAPTRSPGPQVHLPTHASASVAQTLPSNPFHSPVATSPVSPSVSSSHRRLQSGSTLQMRAGRGPYSPKHTTQQWAGEVRSTTPPQSESVKPFAKRKPLPKRRKAPQQSTAAQANEAIDLTGETEQERQDLLSSFRARALSAGEQQIEPTTSTGTPNGASRNVLSRPLLTRIEREAPNTTRSLS